MDTLRENEIAFVICVEANRLEPQARLLCESIRTFAGRYRNAPIIAVSPRPALALGAAARAELEKLGVTYVARPLNETGSPYGSINRIVASAWAETFSDRPYLVVLDTDTLFVAEPQFVRADAGARPVDVKGMASAGADDPQDPYWTRICTLGGIDLSQLPMISTSIDNVRIRASFNGGFVVVRRELAIFEKTREIFFASYAENLRSRPNVQHEIFASTGNVGVEASQWWGSSQAALSVAIWSKTTDVHLYDVRYNVPLNNLGGDHSWPTSASFPPVFLHYHYLGEPQYQPHFLHVLSLIGCSSEVIAWVEARLPYFG